MSFPDITKAGKPDAFLPEDPQAAAAGLMTPGPVGSGPISITGEPTYDIYVRHKNRIDGFRVQRNTSKAELSELLRDCFSLDNGMVVLRHNNSIVSMSAMAANTKEDPYILDTITGTEDRRTTRKNSNMRRYTVDDKLAVQDPGNKHYKNEQNALKWGKENLKDMGAPVIQLSTAIRLCRHLRTLQTAFGLNLSNVSLADLGKESYQNFVREAARFVKGESKRTRKVDDARVQLLRNPEGNVGKLFEQINQMLRRDHATLALPDENDLAYLCSKMTSRDLAVGLPPM